MTRWEAAHRLRTGATHLPRGVVIEYRAGDPVFSRQRRQPMQIANTIAYMAVAVSLLSGFMVGAAQAAGDKAEHIMVAPDAVKWVDAPPSLPAGAKWAVLEGNPTDAGPFAFRVKVPAGYKLPPHKHPNIEHVTVISGTFHFGMGEQLDESKVKPMPAGSFVVIPTDSPHYFLTKDETVVQVHGIGPWGITFVNPADDPRQRTGQR
jgi:quercetin dioxygenase-like cupin family protein